MGRASKQRKKERRRSERLGDRQEPSRADQPADLQKIIKNLDARAVLRGEAPPASADSAGPSDLSDERLRQVVDDLAALRLARAGATPAEGDRLSRAAVEKLAELTALLRDRGVPEDRRAPEARSLLDAAEKRLRERPAASGEADLNRRATHSFDAALRAAGLEPGLLDPGRLREDPAAIELYLLADVAGWLLTAQGADPAQAAAVVGATPATQQANLARQRYADLRREGVGRIRALWPSIDRPFHRFNTLAEAARSEDPAVRPKASAHVAKGLLEGRLDDRSALQEVARMARSSLPKAPPAVEVPDHEALVSAYVDLLEGARREASVRAGSDEARHTTLLWSMLREARVFELPGSLYLRLHHEVDRYVEEQLAHGAWEPPREERPGDAEAAEAYLKACIEHGQRQPWPEKHPFDVTYLGFVGTIPRWDRRSIAALGLGADVLRGVAGWISLLGVLLDRRGNCFYLLAAIDHQGRPQRASVYQHSVRSNWTNSMSLAPWIVPALLRFIDEHKTVTTACAAYGEERAWRRRLKADPKLRALRELCPLPPPYYCVRLDDRVTNEWARRHREGLPRPHRAPGHRFDVREHDVLRLYRGAGAIDPHLERRLRKRHYLILPPGKAAPFEVHHALARRGLAAKRPDEWMAILVSRRREHVKGDPSLPYVPSTRVAADPAR